MSRSRRKTPIMGITLAETEKSDKRIAARQERGRITRKLKPHVAADDDLDLTEFGQHPRNGHWIFSKDGKLFIDLARSPRFEKGMRK